MHSLNYPLTDAFKRHLTLSFTISKCSSRREAMAKMHWNCAQLFKSWDLKALKGDLETHRASNSFEVYTNTLDLDIKT